MVPCIETIVHCCVFLKFWSLHLYCLPPPSSPLHHTCFLFYGQTPHQSHPHNEDLILIFSTLNFNYFSLQNIKQTESYKTSISAFRFFTSSLISFSLNRPTGPIQSSSRNVRPYLVPFPCNFLACCPL